MLETLIKGKREVNEEGNLGLGKRQVAVSHWQGNGKFETLEERNQESKMNLKVYICSLNLLKEFCDIVPDSESLLLPPFFT